MDAQTANTYRPDAAADRMAAGARRSTRQNFLAGMVARNQSEHFFPKHQVLLAIDAKHKQINNDFWDLLTSVRVLPSRHWVTNLIAEALERNPGCPYRKLDWVSASVFDNYTEQ
eukprot:3220438-Pleurochrysis_carterae.AAC.1